GLRGEEGSPAPRAATEPPPAAPWSPPTRRASARPARPPPVSARDPSTEARAPRPRRARTPDWRPRRARRPPAAARRASRRAHPTGLPLHDPEVVEGISERALLPDPPRLGRRLLEGTTSQVGGALFAVGVSEVDPDLGNQTQVAELLRDLGGALVVGRGQSQV